KVGGSEGRGRGVKVLGVAGASGVCSFKVNPGTYTVSEVLQSGWTQSFPAAPGTYVITLTSGQTDSGNDFGNFQQATKSGRKFNDLNGNGKEDAGEPGLSGWTIKLDGTDGLGNAEHLSTTTDTRGAYSFRIN